MCTSRWRECPEEDDHHRGDPVLPIDGAGLSENCKIQQDYRKKSFIKTAHRTAQQ